MEPHAVARMLAVGGTYQELSAATPLVGANHVFRVWRKGNTSVVKVYGSEDRQRREFHALNALAHMRNLPEIIDRGESDGTHWIMFGDAGQWNLQTLPENPGLARAAGAILRDLHDIDAAPLSNLARGMDGEWISLDFVSTIKRLERYRAKVGVSMELIEGAREMNPPFASAPVVAHTDPTVRNFIVDVSGQLTLIDWEGATLAPFEWDLSRAVWSINMYAGPAAAEALIAGYGREIDGVQLDRWIVYHSAQTLVRHAERHMSTRTADAQDNLVSEFSRAVLGGGSA